MGLLWWNDDLSDEEKTQEAIDRFPAVFEKAREDWVKFKLGVERGLFSRAERRRVLDWYAKFPDLWEGVRPNWQVTIDGSLVSAHKLRFAERVDSWVSDLTGSPVLQGQLGFVITGSIIIGGYIVLGLFGVGGIIWALSYYKEQANNSELIGAVTEGRIPPEVLQTAMAQETGGGGFFDDILAGVSDMAMIGIAGAGLYLAWPWLKKLNAKGARG